MQALEWKEIKDWDLKTIESKVDEVRGQLFGMKMQKAASGYEKTHEFKTAKKNIARLLTAKNQLAKSKQ